MKTRWLAAAATIAVIVVFFGCDRKPAPDAGVSETSAPEAVNTAPPYSGPESPPPAERIIHGGGEFGRFTVTNSENALSAAYERGARYIELDFVLTKDGEPVCLHDWNRNYLPGHSDDDFPLDLEEFESSLIFGELTPLSLKSLAGLLREYEGLYIITDCKEDNLRILEKIASAYPELISRFIPQIYFPQELEAVRAMGFKSVILTLYRLDWDMKTDTDFISEFSAAAGLWGVTFPVELTEREGYVEALLASGVSLYTHTVNVESEISALLKVGVTGVYTDLY